MDLEVLITSRNPLIAVETIEEDRLEELTQRLSLRLSLPLYVWDCNNGLALSGAKGPIYQTQDPNVALATVAEIKAGIFFFKDLRHYLEDHKVQRKLREVVTSFSANQTILFVSPASEYPSEMREILIDYPMPRPNKEQLRELINQFLKTSPLVENMLSRQDTEQVLENLKGLTAFEAKRALSQAVVGDGALQKNDIQSMASLKKKFVEQDNLVSYISPEDNLNLVGGLDNLKDWIRTRKIAFEQTRNDLPAPKGVLLIGVPGCGKTLCARAIAHELGIGLIKLDPGRLYNKYIGETEKNLRRVLQLAESLAPVVLLIDEVEKVLPRVDGGTSDGGLSQRLFGTFLSWLQDRQAPVFVVATSNNIQALPPEFSRKGRFDEIFFVDLPALGEREVIFDIHLKRRNIDSATIDLKSLATRSEGFSGSEIEEAILSSLYAVASGTGNISTEIIAAELGKTIPLSRRESGSVEALRQWASANAIRA